MRHLHCELICVLSLGLGVGLAFNQAACTPATSDEPLPVGPSGGSESSAAGTSGGPVMSAGAGNEVSAGGNPSQAGAAQSGGGLTEAGGTSAVGGGGTTPSGAAGLAGGGEVGGAGAPAANGCNWVKGSDNRWSMNAAAADKVVLFDGADLSQWHRLNQPTTAAQWKVLPGGMMEVVPQPTPTNIQSNAKFDDVCLHVEYWTPAYASGVGVQMQGNSGVYLKSAYEMQVLDTSMLGKLIDGCGAVYKVSPPLVVACTQHETWNTYEIEFKGSVWDASTPPNKTKNAVFVQVALNGQLVQQNVTLNPPGGFTEAGIPDVAGPQPIALQDHRDYVRYRNIWATVPHY